MAQIEMKKKATGRKEIQLKDYQTIPISSRFELEIQPASTFEELSDVKKRLIDTIWEQEQKRKGGKLYNALILSAIAYDSKKLIGQLVPYKYFLAQWCDPSLKPDLKIVPVSISGLTIAWDNIVVAKRAEWVTQYPNCYELAPSGGVSQRGENVFPLDLKEQLFEELKEELGILRLLVKGVKFFALVRDFNTDGVELCAEIKVKPYSLQASSHEYVQLISIPKNEIQSFVDEHAAEFVPLSLVILKLRKYIR